MTKNEYAALTPYNWDFSESCADYPHYYWISTRSGTWYIDTPREGTSVFEVRLGPKTGDEQVLAQVPTYEEALAIAQLLLAQEHDQT